MSIKHETITCSGTVMYCDGCGKRGPETAYDNIEDTIDCAHMEGWENVIQDGEDGDLGDGHDLCPECVVKTRASKP